MVWSPGGDREGSGTTCTGMRGGAGASLGMSCGPFPPSTCTHEPGVALGGGRWAAVRMAGVSESPLVISLRVALLSTATGFLVCRTSSVHTVVLVLEMGRNETTSSSQ